MTPDQKQEEQVNNVVRMLKFLNTPYAQKFYSEFMIKAMRSQLLDMVSLLTSGMLRYDNATSTTAWFVALSDLSKKEQPHGT